MNENEQAQANAMSAAVDALEYHTDMIQMATGGGPKEVPAVIINGSGWAVTPAVVEVATADDHQMITACVQGWSVTHIKSGYAVARMQCPIMALKAAQQFAVMAPADDAETVDALLTMADRLRPIAVAWQAMDHVDWSPVALSVLASMAKADGSMVFAGGDDEVQG